MEIVINKLIFKNMSPFERKDVSKIIFSANSGRFSFIKLEFILKFSGTHFFCSPLLSVLDFM